MYERTIGEILNDELEYIIGFLLIFISFTIIHFVFKQIKNKSFDIKEEWILLPFVLIFLITGISLLFNLNFLP